MARISVTTDDGTQCDEFLLAHPDVGMHLPPMTWGIRHTYSLDTALLVFASERFDADDYIRDYAAFVALATGCH